MAETAIGVEVAVDGDDNGAEIMAAVCGRLFLSLQAGRLRDIPSHRPTTSQALIWLSLISDTTIAQRLASMTKCARPKRLRALLAND
jgi:hypothetical protein